jgi:signal transduction histidine kinase
MESWLRAHPVLVDAVLVVLLTAAVVLLGGAGFYPTQQGPVEVLANLALVSTLFLRRVAPVLSFTLMSLLLAGQLLTSSVPLVGDAVLPFGLYAIAAYGPTWARWAGLATGLLGAVLATWRWSPDYDPLTWWEQYGERLALLSAVVLFSWTLGSLRRTRQGYIAGLEERARQLERDAEQRALLAAAGERSRIAREMHDVVAHSLSVIVVQADGALYASGSRPEAAAEALSTISATGRESLAQMRRLIGVLHDDAGYGSDRSPMPSVADIDSLVEQVRGSGVGVELSVRGDSGQVDDATGLTVYRIVQEALTNTLKHGGPDVHASVEVAYEPEAVSVVVEDDGRGAASRDDGDGHGLLGMRQRIAVHEGNVLARPRPGGGFEVRATVPYARTGAS